MSKPPIFVLTGPTASGKTALAVEFAERHGFVILSADSMSLYREMDIGTAKPSAEDRQRVPHFGIDLVGPEESFDSARYVEYADRVIADVHKSGQRVLLAGGTPLYLVALLQGFFDGPKAQPELRAKLVAAEEAEPGCLHDRLRRVDPVAAERIHPNDTKRLVRALEVEQVTGIPISKMQQQFEADARYEHRIVCVDLPREVLRERVRSRTKAMFDAGFVDEVRRIKAGSGFGPTAGAAIGYQQVLEFLDGKIGADELPYKVRSATHRLVRRQQTWFRRMRHAVRLESHECSLQEQLDRLEKHFDVHGAHGPEKATTRSAVVEPSESS